MNGTPLQLALREVREAYQSPRMLIGMAVVAVILGYAGPFGTFAELSLAPRLAYWAVNVFLTYGIGLFAGMLFVHLLQRWARGPAARIGIIGFVASLPVTLAVALVNLGFLQGNPFLLPGLAQLWSYCLAISLGVGVMHEMLGPPSAPKLAGPVAPLPAAPPAILERVPLPQRGRLLALSVKDHYVEVMTDRGRALVLMRLSDAMRETGDVAGLQIHRSHWVALDAVRRVVKTGGKVAVELPGGERLPVSRGFLTAVRQAGLLV